MWNRKGLKMRAKEVFKTNYWKCVLAALVFTLVAGGFSSSATYNQDTSSLDLGSFGLGHGFNMLFTGVLAGSFVISLAIAVVLLLFVVNPLRVGIYKFFVKNLHEKAELKELAFAWKTDKFFNMGLTMLLMSIYETLWALLLIVPGVIKHYEYKMIPYLLAENPDMDREEAFAISKKMMMGNKMDAFVLDLSFIGWDILNAFTFGLLGVFWIEPYRQQAYAALYDAIRMTRDTEAAHAAYTQSAYTQTEAAEAVEPETAETVEPETAQADDTQTE